MGAVAGGHFRGLLLGGGGGGFEMCDRERESVEGF